MQTHSPGARKGGLPPKPVRVDGAPPSPSGEPGMLSGGLALGEERAGSLSAVVSG